MGTIRVTQAATIDAPPDAVYGLLADYRTGHPSVLPKALQIVAIEKGGYGAGTVVRVRSHIGGVTRLARFRVSEPEPGRVLRESEPETGTVTDFIVTPEADGGQCRLAIVTTIDGRGGPVGAVEGFFARLLLNRVYRAELRNIARVAHTVAAQ